MRYISTRGGNAVASVSFETAICTGYAPDGGLYVPESLPALAPFESRLLYAWSHLSYPELTYRILRQFIASDEISDTDLRSICHTAFTGFENPDNAVPVVSVGNLYISELFHGPTFCFKDLGMRVLLGLLSHFATKRTRPITLLVSTTGDTGPAAVQAVSDLANPLLSLLVHYPYQQISDFQRRQMTTTQSSRVQVAAFEGGGDDMDKPLKRLLAQAPPEKTWTGVNSYNIGRPLTQLVHYVWTYLRVIELEHAKRHGPSSSPTSQDFVQPVTFVVPTGAMGNLTGGILAHRLGLPISQLIAAVNVNNDASHQLFQTGVLTPPNSTSLPMQTTLSEAMNVQLPYNLERLLYYATNSNAALVHRWMTDIDAGHSVDLNSTTGEEEEEQGLEHLRHDIQSISISDDHLCDAIRDVWTHHQYCLDPHTAVGWAAAAQLGWVQQPSNQSLLSSTDEAHHPPVALLATASPCKFERACTLALGSDAWDTYAASESYPTAAQRVWDGDEVEPTFYPAQGSLEESQRLWETMALQLIQKLEDTDADADADAVVALP